MREPVLQSFLSGKRNYDFLLNFLRNIGFFKFDSLKLNGIVNEIFNVSKLIFLVV